MANYNYLTQTDVENYGTDLVDFAQRAATHALAPTIQQIHQQNAELRQRLAVEARARLDQQVEQAVPNYREIDRDPNWHRWLLTVDPYTGRIRQEWLNDAIARSDANRVIHFFRQFQRENQVMGQAPASARVAQHRAPVQHDRPVYTRDQIARLYRQHQQGAYAGRAAEWARQEADIYTAQREGRVVGGTDIHGK